LPETYVSDKGTISPSPISSDNDESRSSLDADTQHYPLLNNSPGDSDTLKVDFCTLQDLLRKNTLSKALTFVVTEGPVLTQQALLKILSDLQKKNCDLLSIHPNAKDSKIVGGNLQAYLRNSFHEQNQFLQGLCLAKVDQDAFAIMAMIFEFILEDSYLPDPLKGIFYNLYVPLLKVVIVDKTFFSNPQHPAQKLFNGSARDLVVKSREILVPTLAKLAEDFFEAVDAIFYELTDNPGSSYEDAAICLDDIKLLHRHRQYMQTEFQTRVLTTFDVFWLQSPRVLSMLPDSKQSVPVWAVVNNTESEIATIISSIISRIENRCYKDLYRLNIRFSSLLGGLGIDKTSNPLGPTALCTQFHKTVKKLELNTKTLITIYSIFEKHLTNNAVELYSKINLLFRKVEVLPETYVSDKGTISPSPISSDNDESRSSLDADTQHYPLLNNSPGDSDTLKVDFCTLQDLLR
ncbi:hypothetical protein TI04_11680, partial [Achromatium sp. WMS2]